MTQPPLNVPPVMPPPVATPQFSPASATPPRKGWFRRNLAWIIPVGCLTMLVLAVLFVGAIFFFVMSTIKTMAPYEEALSAARASTEVVDALGEPIEPGRFVMGNVNVSGAGGTADLSVSLSGPKGKGRLYLVAEKSAGEWTFQRLEVEIEGRRERIDLLKKDIT